MVVRRLGVRTRLGLNALFRHPWGDAAADQIAGADAVEIDASEDEANRHQLY